MQSHSGLHLGLVNKRVVKISKLAAKQCVSRIEQFRPISPAIGHFVSTVLLDLFPDLSVGMTLDLFLPHLWTSEFLPSAPELSEILYKLTSRSIAQPWMKWMGRCVLSGRVINNFHAS